MVSETRSDMFKHVQTRDIETETTTTQKDAAIIIDHP